MINLKINNIPVSVEPGTTILEAARKLGINIPTLCYLKDINEIGACRICTVEVKNAKGLLPACVYPVNEGMEVFTNTKKVLDARKKNLELLLSVHHKECLSCPRSGSCEFQKLCNDYNITDEHYYDGAKNEYEIDDSAVHMIRDNSKCVLCRRCVAVCRKYQDCGVIGPNERGFATHIGTAFDQDLADVACVSCGQCITACPTGALQEKDSTDAVWAALSDPEKTVIVQTAPAVRVGLGEAFGLPMGTNVEGKMAFDGRYKLVYRAHGQMEFFDLERDPLEEHNLYTDGQYAAKILELQGAMLAWYQDTCDIVPFKADARWSGEMFWQKVKNIIPPEKAGEMRALIDGGADITEVMAAAARFRKG